MMFSKGHPLYNFSIGFARSPRLSFGVYAKGYHRAANALADLLMRKDRFADHEAYPVVFLYRHALELHLKNIVYKAVHLSQFKLVNDIDGKLHCNHNLCPLANVGRRILIHIFPNDKRLRAVADKFVAISKSVSDIDSSSFVYRYPIDKQGKPALERRQTVNLFGLSKSLDEMLGQLEVIDFGISVETDIAQELWEILMAVKDWNGSESETE